MSLKMECHYNIASTAVHIIQQFETGSSCQYQFVLYNMASTVLYTIQQFENGSKMLILICIV